MEKENNPEALNEVKLVVAVVLGILILFLALFISYRFSRSQPSSLILPNGTTYVGPSPSH